jgi:hypothetical protein
LHKTEQNNGDLESKKKTNKWLWSGASVANTALVQEDLGSILTQTQIALLDLSSPFFQTTDFKTISFI